MPCQFQGKFKSERPLGVYMAGASPEDSEPLFVLEPLPELPSVIDSFFGANPLLLIAGFGSIIYLLTKYEDPFTKLWTSTLVFSGLSFFVTDSMFYSMIFASRHLRAVFMVWSAIRWDDVNLPLGFDRARILSISSFIVCTWIMTILGTAIGMPTTSGVVVCGLAMAYVWWTYYSLEPSTS